MSVCTVKWANYLSLELILFFSPSLTLPDQPTDQPIDRQGAKRTKSTNDEQLQQKKQKVLSHQSKIDFVASTGLKEFGNVG